MWDDNRDLSLKIFARPGRHAREENTTEQGLTNQQIWENEQEKLKSLSPLSWRVIARGAGHAVHHDRLKLVVDEITRLIGYIRGGPAPPFGSTAVE